MLVPNNKKVRPDVDIYDLAEDFSVRIGKMYKYLLDRKEKRISDQVYRSGTSIAANVNEAKFAESKQDFLHKMKIALKEAGETGQWIRTLHKLNYLDDRAFESIHDDCQHIQAMLINITRTTSMNLDAEGHNRG